jgi:hypothetical protein
MVNCRSGCGACCIAPSISPSYPALPDGKPAGVVCPHLTGDRKCRLFGLPERPAPCVGLRPQPEMCGESTEQAMSTLLKWEELTIPRR